MSGTMGGTMHSTRGGGNSGGGNVPDPPADSKQYVMQNGVWTLPDYAGAGVLELNDEQLTRVIDGLTTVVKSSFPAQSTFVINVTTVYDNSGTVGVYIGDSGPSAIYIKTISVSSIGGDEPSLLGNVGTKAELPPTVSATLALWGRTPKTDDYATVLRDETRGNATVEYYITNIDGSGNITWGNPRDINTSDYQMQTTAADAGKVLVGGSAPGTFGTSKGFDAVPTKDSPGLLTSGVVFAANEAERAAMIAAIAAHNNDQNAHAALFGVGGKIRKRLTANTTFYLRSDGNDANTGLGNTSALAWKTIPGAIANLEMVDQGSFIATLSLQGGVNFGAIWDIGNGLSGKVKIVSSDPNNMGRLTVVSVTGPLNKNIELSGIQLDSGVRVNGGAVVTVSGSNKISMSTASDVGLTAMRGAFIYLAGASITISGTSPAALNSNGGNILVPAYSGVVNLTFDGYTASTAVAVCNNGGTMGLAEVTLLGTAVGKRYQADSGGTIISLKGAEGIPGTIAGTISTQGRYI